MSQSSQDNVKRNETTSGSSPSSFSNDKNGGQIVSGKHPEACSSLSQSSSSSPTRKCMSLVNPSQPERQQQKCCSIGGDGAKPTRSNSASVKPPPWSLSVTCSTKSSTDNHAASSIFSSIQDCSIQKTTTSCDSNTPLVTDAAFCNGGKQQQQRSSLLSFVGSRKKRCDSPLIPLPPSPSSSKSSTFCSNMDMFNNSQMPKLSLSNLPSISENSSSSSNNNNSGSDLWNSTKSAKSCTPYWQAEFLSSDNKQQCGEQQQQKFSKSLAATCGVKACATTATRSQNRCYRRNRSGTQGPLEYQDNGCHRELAANLVRLYYTGALCDVELLVEKHTFRAHKVVLASTSNYFMAMFTRGMRETSMRQIRLEGIDADSMREIIDFCYTGRVFISERNVCTLLPVASMLQVQGVVIACTKFLVAQLDPCNVIGIIEFAEQNDCKCLLKRSRAYFDENFVDVSMNEEFLHLDITQLLTIMHRDDLFVPDEQEVYHAALRWVLHNEPERRIYVEAILTAVRCYLLPPVFLQHHLDHCVLLQQLPRCRKYLQHVLELHLQHRGPADFPGGLKKATARAREPPICMDVCGDPVDAAGNHTTKLSSSDAAKFQRLNDVVAVGPAPPPLQQQQQQQPNCSAAATSECDSAIVNSASSNSSSATVLKKLTNKPRRPVHVPYVVYICGGYKEESLNDTMAFQPGPDGAVGTWTQLAPMTRPRSGCAAAIVHGLMYVVGGRTNTAHTVHSELREVDVYDPFSDKWMEGPPALQPRNRPGVGVIDNKLYVLGGCSAAPSGSMGGVAEGGHAIPVAAVGDAGGGGRTQELTYLNTAECFDSTSNQWKQIASMHHARLGAAVAATCNRFLYAVGGTDGTERHNSVERYDPDRDRWQLLTPMLTRRSGAAAVALEGYVYIMGGYDGERQLASVERFEPPLHDDDDDELSTTTSCRSGRWNFVAPMLSSRSAFAAVVLNNMIYLFGGYDGTEFVSKVDRYDPVRNEWIHVSDIPQIGRSGVGAAVWFGSPLFALPSTRQSSSSSSGGGGGGNGDGGGDPRHRRSLDESDIDELRHQYQLSCGTTSPTFNSSNKRSQRRWHANSNNNSETLSSDASEFDEPSSSSRPQTKMQCLQEESGGGSGLFASTSSSTDTGIDCELQQKNSFVLKGEHIGDANTKKSHHQPCMLKRFRCKKRSLTTADAAAAPSTSTTATHSPANSGGDGGGSSLQHGECKLRLALSRLKRSATAHCQKK